MSITKVYMLKEKDGPLCYNKNISRFSEKGTVYDSMKNAKMSLSSARRYLFKILPVIETLGGLIETRDTLRELEEKLRECVLQEFDLTLVKEFSCNNGIVCEPIEKAEENEEEIDFSVI